MKTRIVTAVISCFFFMTTAHGQSLWKEVALPHVGDQLTMIDFADSLAGWIFADSGTYLKTRDGGKS